MFVSVVDARASSNASPVWGLTDAASPVHPRARRNARGWRHDAGLVCRVADLQRDRRSRAAAVQPGQLVDRDAARRDRNRPRPPARLEAPLAVRRSTPPRPTWRARLTPAEERRSVLSRASA